MADFLLGFFAALAGGIFCELVYRGLTHQKDLCYPRDLGKDEEETI